MASGKQIFDNTIYGSSSGGGGGGGNRKFTMGSPSQVASGLGIGRKKSRSKGRSKRR